MTGMNPEYGAGYEGWPDGFAGPEAPQRPERLYRRVKGDARRALSSRWGKGAAGVLFLAGCGTVFYLLTQIIGGEIGLPARGVWLEAGTLRIDLGRLALDGLMLIPAGVLLSPLILGYLAFLYRLTSGEEASLREIFQPLQDLKLWARSVGMLVLLGGVSLLSAGVGLLPGAGLIYFTLGLPGSTGRAAILKIALLVLAFLLLAAGVLFAGYFMVRFIPAPFFLASGEQGGVLRSAARSVRATKGFRGELFTMALSFIPCTLLLIFIAPAVFVLPYEWAAFGLFSRFLADRLSREEAAGHAGDAG